MEVGSRENICDGVLDERISFWLDHTSSVSKKKMLNIILTFSEHYVRIKLTARRLTPSESKRGKSSSKSDPVHLGKEGLKSGN